MVEIDPKQHFFPAHINQITINCFKNQKHLTANCSPRCIFTFFVVLQKCSAKKICPSVKFDLSIYMRRVQAFRDRFSILTRNSVVEAQAL